MTHSFEKIIWQTHNYKKEWLPAHLNQIAATWKNLNPEWDYRYIDHLQRDEMVKKHKEIYEIYKYQPPTHQSDIWRSIVTYQEGGCYADMDSVCVKPLDDFLNNVNNHVQMLLVPKNNGIGNNHNYITKKQSSPMIKIFKEMKQNPEKLVGWGMWNMFVNSAYSDSRTSELFFVENLETRTEDVVAIHSDEYKKDFDPTGHFVNIDGKIIGYLEFLKNKKVSIFL